MKYLPTESAESADKATTAPNIPTEAVEIFKEKEIHYNHANFIY